MTTYYKWLRGDNSAPIGKGKWTPKRWRSVKGALIACENGLHLCRPQDIIHHMSERLWTVEADTSELVEASDKVVVRRARILEPVTTLNDKTLRLFACDCAARVVHLANDERSKTVVAVARQYAHGNATKEELAAARDAAWDAAWAAARDAARDAAWDAAWAAARDAAWAAAWDAARDAAWAAARDAAWDAARDAQAKRLMQYVEHGEAAEQMPWAE